MIDVSVLQRSLLEIVRELEERQKGFALVGGLAVSLRTEVRFTRDVDVAVVVSTDTEAESLVMDLRSAGYRVAATVEHEVVDRLSTVRLLSANHVKVDLLFASSGIEPEIVARAEPVSAVLGSDLPVACAEELLAMKVLSMTPQRLQDRIDAQNLIAFTPKLDLERVRDNLRLIGERGFDRNRDLAATLSELLAPT